MMLKLTLYSVFLTIIFAAFGCSEIPVSGGNSSLGAGDRQVQRAGGGPLSGAFVYAGNAGSQRIAPEQVEPLLDEFAALKLDTLLLVGLRAITGECGNPTFQWGPDFPDKLGLFLDGAQARGMEVYVSVTSTSDSCKPYEWLLYQGRHADEVREMASQLNSKYGEHPAFKGWYIPDEPLVMLPGMTSYYKALSAAIRASSDKPIVVAPYLATIADFMTPAMVASWAKSFSDQTKDAAGRSIIQAWQDSVGAKATNLDWRSGSTVEDYYRAISQAIGRENLWSDIELFNGPVPPFSGGPYAACSVMRLNSQFWAARDEFTSKQVSWLPQIQMGSVDKEHFVEGPRLASAYNALYGIKGAYLKPSSYSWLTEFSPQYADDGQELINTKVGDPINLSNKEWVGALGAAEVQLELGDGAGASVPLDYAAVHLLADDKAGILLPKSLTLTCLEGGAVKQTHTEQLPFEAVGGKYEYTFSNLAPLGWRCGAVRVRVDGSQWIFLSEVELHHE